jgi:hypothetical protein
MDKTPDMTNIADMKGTSWKTNQQDVMHKHKKH